MQFYNGTYVKVKNYSVSIEQITSFSETTTHKFYCLTLCQPNFLLTVFSKQQDDYIANDASWVLLVLLKLEPEKPWMSSSEVPSMLKENVDSTSESSSTSLLFFRTSYYSLQNIVSKEKGSLLQ